jgi:hypothetical protein
LRHGDGPWYRRTFKAMIVYLGDNAKRAHPKRDARTGRTALDLQPGFKVSDRKAIKGKTSQPMAA